METNSGVSTVAKTLAAVVKGIERFQKRFTVQLAKVSLKSREVPAQNIEFNRQPVQERQFQTRTESVQKSQFQNS
jgi:hypothetical protein